MEWLLNYIANRYMVRMIIFFGLAHHVNTKNTLFLTKHRQVKKRHICMSLTFMKGAPLTSLFRFLPHLFLQEMFIYCQLRVAYILLVYATWVEIIGQKFFCLWKQNVWTKDVPISSIKALAWNGCWIILLIGDMVWMIIFFALAHHVKTKNTLNWHNWHTLVSC